MSWQNEDIRVPHPPAVQASTLLGAANQKKGTLSEKESTNEIKN